MLGAIIGDIVGSRFEWNNIKSKDFELFAHGCRPTDDSIMSLAVAKAILLSGDDRRALGENAVRCMQELGRKYPNAGYGGGFSRWLSSDSPKPYGSWGNGSAMRVGPCGFACGDIEEARSLAKTVSAVSHDHPEAIKGAQATACAIYMARSGSSISDIRGYINSYYYKINFLLDDIRAEYSFDVSCQGSVPQALESFFESVSFEDAIRGAVSIGGDSDTIAAIAGSVAEAYYGIPENLASTARSFLSPELLYILDSFENKYGDFKK